MPKETVWEAICHLAGKDGAAPVSYSEALRRAAVPPETTKLEISQMIDRGLITTPGDDTILLTEQGKLSMSDLGIREHSSPAEVREQG